MSAARVDAYLTQTIATADPVTLVTMLYDGAIKAVRKARLQHEDSNRTGSLDATGRAVLIVGELMAALDMDQGEVAEGLSALYAYCMRRLAEATWDEIPDAVDEVERLLTRVADAWKQATAPYRPTVSAAPRLGNAA
jgi:flagellar protein FliS